MFKKIIYLNILLMSMVFGAVVNTNKANYNPNKNITVSFSGMQAQNKDWIGIYPLGSTNDWGNQVAWAWTNDRVQGNLNFDALPEGHYEVRAFYNNSFHVEGTKQFSVTVNAATIVNTNKATYNPHENIRVSFSGMQAQNRDWIGIYPVGSSNDWAKQVGWAWTKDKVNGNLNFEGLPVGEYEVRAFYNNSFNVEATKQFRVIGNAATIVNTNKATYNSNENIRVSFFGMQAQNRDWIGIYPVGSSNDWAKQVGWAWTKDKVNGNLNFEGLSVGEYEVRAFYNNSFNVEATKQFRVTGNGDVPPQIPNRIKLIKDIYRANETVTVNIKNVPELGKPRPWVGIYEVGEESTFEYLAYYQFTDQAINGKLKLTRTKDSEPLHRYKAINQPTQYELRMVAWVNGEYVIYDTKNISIHPILNKQNIHDSFDKHYEYFEQQMHKRLKKNAKGYGDTYVLYDVQMHMQDAIIYADENADMYMLHKLLSLCLIPFESRYVTGDKWLYSGRYGNEGKEVTLVLSQYFSLLTRVLSAAERHGIATNLSNKKINIIYKHINQWINDEAMNKTRVADKYIFFVQSSIQFSDYAKRKTIPIDTRSWKSYSQEYMRDVINPRWEKVNCGQGIKNCLALDRTGWVNSKGNDYAGYGKEILDEKSNNPKAMFDVEGNIKHPIKRVPKVAEDISHARRYNWFFETLLRYGDRFGISISKSTLRGWSNNLAYRVARGTKETPYFTTFSDGVDGWYRVNYRAVYNPNRKGKGYSPGEMDIHFVGSSYGMMGSYNPKIRTWMKGWVRNHDDYFDFNNIRSYYGGYSLSYYTNMEINLHNSIIGL